MPDLISRPQANCAPGRSSDAFDLAALLARCMDDAPMAAALIERFTTRLPVFIRDLDRLLAAQQWAPAAAKAHTLKGEAGSLGAVELHAAASLLEQSLRAGSQETAAAQLDTLKKYVQACIRARVSALEQLSQKAARAPQSW